MCFCQPLPPHKQFNFTQHLNLTQTETNVLGNSIGQRVGKALLPLFLLHFVPISVSPLIAFLWCNVDYCCTSLTQQTHSLSLKHTNTVLSTGVSAWEITLIESYKILIYSEGKSYGNSINKGERLSYYSLLLSPIWKCNNKHTLWFAQFLFITYHFLLQPDLWLVKITKYLLTNCYNENL